MTLLKRVASVFGLFCMHYVEKYFCNIQWRCLGDREVIALDPGIEIHVGE